MEGGISTGGLFGAATGAYLANKNTKNKNNTTRNTVLGAAAGYFVGSRLFGGGTWIEHVKAYKAHHGCSYKEALIGAKATWHKSPKRRSRSKSRGHFDRDFD